ncbi:hypothetical protein [Aeribacillus alveayuensis]|uniref:Uncharacterized protein n=1 Tax=Aeribacillus alveayuensis TaxID=279215 RepID=A0ABT9VRU8_9BACI|nr:hypothetical protein [Bacillus alveayuensis]
MIKKNAGETSILALAFLLVHHYGNKIKQNSISTSDFAVVENNYGYVLGSLGFEGTMFGELDFVGVFD